jgi:hypothetical protein
MTEETALASSTGWAHGDYIGYLGFKAANFLVSTKKYEFADAGPWGYVVRKVVMLR